ncbi:hypothetical protein Aperf_G00000049348 [Anoplocephala perfoliata]
MLTRNWSLVKEPGCPLIDDYHDNSSRSMRSTSEVKQPHSKRLYSCSHSESRSLETRVAVVDSTAPFGEQTRVAVATNYTATHRLVNVASLAAANSFDAMSKEMTRKFRKASTLKELDELMPNFVKSPFYLATLPDDAKEPVASSFLNARLLKLMPDSDNFVVF